jgi:hypothetical protein
MRSSEIKLRLKRCARPLDKLFPPGKQTADQANRSSEAAALALRLAAELRDWPTLGPQLATGTAFGAL